MEEEELVWNDLSLSSLYDNSATSRRSLNLPDFLLDCPLSRTNIHKPVNRDSNTELKLSTRTIACCPKNKKGLVDDACNDEERHIRLIKNRESADRCRAKKQAYTKELEKKVAHLRKENTELKRQLKMLSYEGCTPLPKKKTLHRTVTAPF